MIFRPRIPYTPHPLAPGPQTTCYLPWLKVSVAFRYVLSFPWKPEAWREVRRHIPVTRADLRAGARRARSENGRYLGYARASGPSRG